ncbi:MAG TPA: SAM-dependent chlorinase/fluorinase [Clostridia bacterium]|nr:SAM-dependent chlorinase/fluorinase [Clostridia bacterium]
MHHYIAIQTDFGTADGRAAKLIGTIKRVDQTLDVCFNENKCPRGDVMIAGTFLHNSLAFFPKGTVYVSIIESGTRDSVPCAALTHDDQIILTPNNGTLTIWTDNYGLKALRRLDTAAVPKGMDAYAYFAARLANGTLSYEELGQECAITDVKRFSVRASTISKGFAKGGVLSVLENFGNLNLTVSIAEFENTGIRFGDYVQVTLERDGITAFNCTIPYDRSFGYAELGTPILFNGSTGYIGLGLNQESFANKYMKDRYDHPEGIAGYDVTIGKITEGVIV